MRIFWPWKGQNDNDPSANPENFGHVDAYLISLVSQLPPQTPSVSIATEAHFNPSTIWDGRAAELSQRDFGDSSKPIITTNRVEDNQ